MSTFILTMDLDKHTHDHSPRAHRHIVGQLLDNVKAEVGRSEATEGSLIYPAGSHAVIGTWKFLKSAD
jgi:hypothetical protein